MGNTAHIILICCVFISAVWGRSGNRGPSDWSNSPFDVAGIKYAFDQGDYQTAQAILETTLRSTRDYGILDSVLMARYLAVLYLMEPQTRDKGRYYMFRLLTWMPSDKLEDMRIPEEIRDELEGIRRRFFASAQDGACEASETGGSREWAGGEPISVIRAGTNPSGIAIHGERRSVRRIFYWTLGGASALAASLVLVHIAQEPEVPRKPLKVEEKSGG